VLRFGAESDFLRPVTGTLPCNPTLKIHTEINEARPEVCCILHTHSEASLALGAIGSRSSAQRLHGRQFGLQA
jgi:ribulose-5-phosphate 4-epimerase/fuculose-1-phosphate aldolase